MSTLIQSNLLFYFRCALLATLVAREGNFQYLAIQVFSQTHQTVYLALSVHKVTAAMVRQTLRSDVIQAIIVLRATQHVHHVPRAITA